MLSLCLLLNRGLLKCVLEDTRVAIAIQKSDYSLSSSCIVTYNTILVSLSYAGAATAVPRPELLAGLAGNPVTGGSGWWGQFTNRYGGLHQHNATRMRSNLLQATQQQPQQQGKDGKEAAAMVSMFPFEPVACRGELGAIVRHLRALLPKLAALEA